MYSNNLALSCSEISFYLFICGIFWKIAGGYTLLQTVSNAINFCAITLPMEFFGGSNIAVFNVRVKVIFERQKKRERDPAENGAMSRNTGTE